MPRLQQKRRVKHTLHEPKPTLEEKAFLHNLPDDAFLNTTDAATLIDYEEITLRIWRYQDPPKGPPFIRIGTRSIRYRVGDIRAWLKKQTVEDPSTFTGTKLAAYRQSRGSRLDKARWENGAKLDSIDMDSVTDDDGDE